jgi:hypothetical protein
MRIFFAMSKSTTGDQMKISQSKVLQPVLAFKCIGFLLMTLCVTQTQALPSFARQTGKDCSGCHVGAFGPQLTPAGVKFKISGYTDSDDQPGKIPLSGMFITSFSKTSADQNPPPEHLGSNNNLKLDEAVLFYAGRISQYLGAFVEVAYNGVDQNVSLDQVDIRFSKTHDLAEKEMVWGVSLNNNPGVQDPFNTMPVWSFPYTSSPAGFGTGEAATLINDGLGERVLGASAYAFYDKSFYGELGFYQSLSPSFQKQLGHGEDLQQLGSNVYWRLAYTKDFKSKNFHAGIFGWNATVKPDRSVDMPSNKYRDVGVDASYQYLGTRRHVATFNGSYIHEKMTDHSTGQSNSLKEARLNASYYFDQTWGGSLGLFSTRGTDAAASTNGNLMQVDWTPWGKESVSAPAPFGWANLRLGAQYWMYNNFAGDTENAKDRNTLYLFAWTSF